MSPANPANPFPRQFFGGAPISRHPLAGHTDSLPYPSDIYANPAENTATGIELAFPSGIFRNELLQALPPTLTPQSVFNGCDGFSAATSVLFELDQAPDYASLPEDGGESVVAYNLDTGEAVPLRVQVNKYALSKRVSAPSYIVEIYPRARWAFEGRYVVALTHGVKTAEGHAFTPTDGCLRAKRQDNSTLSGFYEPVFRFLEAKGISRDHILSNTFFTVRSEEEVTAPMKTVSQFVFEQDHPIRNLSVKYPLFGSVGAQVKGELLVHDFRNEDGGITLKPDNAKPQWIRFRLSVPRNPQQEPMPIAIYGHGLTASKETDFIVAWMNAMRGIATISIDHPNHGSRIRQDGGYVLTRLHTRHVPLQVGMMTQSALDFMSLYKAVRTSIGTIDVWANKSKSPFWASVPPLTAQRSLFDIDNIFYQGTSLGGVLGSTFVALAPQLKGAFLHVTGVGITNILSNSDLWGAVFSYLEPKVATGAEAMLLKSIMQHELDYGDSINFVHYFRDPPAFSTPKPVAVTVGLGDGIVPNLCTVAMAEIAQLPLVGKELFPVANTAKREDYEDGFGVTQTHALFNASGLLQGVMAHISFLHPKVYRRMTRWTDEIILGDSSALIQDKLRP